MQRQLHYVRTESKPGNPYITYGRCLGFAAKFVKRNWLAFTAYSRHVVIPRFALFLKYFHISFIYSRSNSLKSQERLPSSRCCVPLQIGGVLQVHAIGSASSGLLTNYVGGFLPEDSPLSPLWQKLLIGAFSQIWNQVRTTSCRTCSRPGRKPDTVSGHETIITSCHTRTLVILYL